ncbi:MAG: hypothetical protein HY360_06605 [Verrucomicrobia bacterium]|nr:hypothetical protein [Verrucomicrobiota bacterium]
MKAIIFLAACALGLSCSADDYPKLDPLPQDNEVKFTWNPKSEKFESPDLGRLALHEPHDTWSLDGLMENLEQELSNK